MARFFRRGISKIYFLPTVASLNAPTAAEVTAGTDLTVQIAEIGGFSLSNSPIAVPDLATSFTQSIAGEDTTDANTITFYDDNTAGTNTIRTALAKGVTGNIVLFPYGKVTGRRAEVWPVQSTGVNDEWSTGNDPARYVVGFANTGVPAQNATSP